ncbi:MAG: hypothetical protein M3Q23_01295 [Actinomycetota bacterium]|nr:hypothetical protein [Actinomycetota bacterium]
MLLFGPTSQEPVQGSSCWTQGSVGTCVDVAGIGTPTRPIEVASGTTLRLSGDATRVQAGIGRLEGDRFRVVQQLDLSSGRDRIAVPLGDYVLDVFGTWPQGESSFDFHIRVT